MPFDAAITVNPRISPNAWTPARNDRLVVDKQQAHSHQRRAHHEAAGLRGGLHFAHGVGNGRQRDAERRAAAGRRAHHFDLAAVRGDDAIAHAQAQPGALALTLRREERLEDVRFAGLEMPGPVSRISSTT